MRHMPARLAVGLPILVAAGIALLVVAHVAKGASTQVDGEAPFGMLTPHATSDDNLISAVRRLADAHAWLLALLVAGLSGIWPYVKLLGTLATVLLVGGDVLSRRRGVFALHTLEVLGKYSFADVFLIAFNFLIFDISTGTYKILAFSLHIELWMQMKLGIVALVVAVTFSALLTHWAVYELSNSTKAEPSEDDQLLKHSEPSSTSDSVLSQVASLWDRFAAVALPILGITVLIFGCCLPVVMVERGGFFGLLIEEPNRNVSMAIFTMMGSFFQPGPSSSWYTVVFAIYFIILAFVAPLLELMLVAFNSFATAMQWPPMWAHKARLGAEWAHSFDCLEVFLLTALTLIVELKVAVEYDMGGVCEPYQTLIDNDSLLSIAGLGFAKSDTCFDPKPSLHAGWPVLAVVVALRTLSWQANRMLLASPLSKPGEA